MSQLSTLISHEYKMDIKAKSFWISTFLIPLLMIGFGGFIGFLSTQSDAMKEMSQSTSPDLGDDITGAQVAGMLCGILLTMFIILYGAQIFNKVKTEKCNRIVEVIVSCAPGRKVMFSKVIGVGLIGLTQFFVWAVLIGGIGLLLYMILPVKIDLSELLSVKAIWALAVSLLFFIGGFVFYGSLFAMAGALTDRNNENQGYLSVIMMLLMVSFYIGVFAVDNMDSPLSRICFYLPFTSPTIGAVGSVSGAVSIWETIASMLLLFASAGFALMLAGKMYTCSLLLKGKKFSPKDIIVFLKSK